MSGFAIDITLLITTVLSLILVYQLQKISTAQPNTILPTLPQKSTGRFSTLLWPQVLIRQAGINPEDIKPLYFPIKIMITLTVILCLYEFPSPWQHGLVVTIAAITGYYSIDLWLLQRRQQRRDQIIHSLSFFIDLIIAQLQAGASLQQAIKTSGSIGFVATHPLALESKLMYAELELGQDWATSFSALWQRTGVTELKQLSIIINTGLRLGVPISSTLAHQSNILRDKQQQLMLKKVNKKNIEMLLPMILVCLPMFFVLVLFPAIVQVSEVFKLLKLLF
ncbi:MAG: tight adherence protein C [Psychromonas sp.]|jgi:tight adherence protein C